MNVNAGSSQALLEHLAQYGSPPPGSASLIDVGSGDFLEFFGKEILDDLVGQGGSTCRFFQGPWGSGKTHLLQLLEDLARNRGMAVVKIDLSQDLSLEDWRLVTLYILQNLELELEGQILRGLPEILDVLGLSDAIERERLEGAKLPHPGFQAAMLRALFDDGLSGSASELLDQYLRGDRIGATILRRQGIVGVKNPLSQRNAEQVLNTVLGGLFHLGLPGTMLLFDENEKTLASASYRYSGRVSRAANLMRRFVDGCFTGGLVGTVAVFAMLPGFVEEAALVYPALGQRLRAPRVSGYGPDWRWPVIPTEEISSARFPEDFVVEATRRLLVLAGKDAANSHELEAVMLAAGKEILETNAGTGYRRALVKALAALVLT